MLHQGDEPDAFFEIIITCNKMIASMDGNLETNVVNIAEEHWQLALLHIRLIALEEPLVRANGA